MMFEKVSDAMVKISRNSLTLSLSIQEIDSYRVNQMPRRDRKPSIFKARKDARPSKHLAAIESFSTFRSRDFEILCIVASSANRKCYVIVGNRFRPGMHPQEKGFARQFVQRHPTRDRWIEDPRTEPRLRIYGINYRRLHIFFWFFRRYREVMLNDVHSPVNKEALIVSFFDRGDLNRSWLRAIIASSCMSFKKCLYYIYIYIQIFKFQNLKIKWKI